MQQSQALPLLFCASWSRDESKWIVHSSYWLLEDTA